MGLVPRMISIPIVPKLVLNLCHDDGPRRVSLRVPLEVAHPYQQLGQVGLGAVLVGGEGAPEEHRVIVQEPAGQAPKLPFTADVGTRPEYGKHVFLCYHLYKSEIEFL